MSFSVTKRIYSFFILFVLFIFSCKEDKGLERVEISNDVFFTLASLQEAQNGFQTNKNALKVQNDDFWNSVKPDWSKATKSHSEKGEFLVIPTTHKPILNYIFLDEKRDLQYVTPPLELIAYKDKSNTLKEIYLLRIPLIDSTKSRLSDLNIKSFTGILIYYDLTGKIISNRYLVNGRSVQSSITNPGARTASTCGWYNHCFYSSPGDGSSGDYGSVYGTSIYTTENCPEFISRPGRTFRLNFFDETYTCLDEDEGGYPTTPNGPPANPPTTGGGGEAYIGTIASSDLDRLLEDFPEQGDKFTVIINNKCQGEDLRAYLSSSKQALDAFVETRDNCLVTAGYGVGAVETLRAGVTLQALVNLFGSQILTAAQKRDLRWGTWMLAIGNLIAMNCIDNAYETWQTKQIDARSTFKVNYDLHSQANACN
ncbi:hypothetical protein [Dyadobacter diqingensis]|uniref:hypothetical protein n=1 Tax=Dyadobacter diqingensis TaxID=2938121 RepID=UPI0020C3C30B|nr:hypothetical protein [Dyadobacter diqingensis]